MNNREENSTSLRALKRSTLWKIRGKEQWDGINSGHNFHADPLWIRWYRLEENPHDPVRLGCAVSKKFGNAVARNTFKRRVKEVVRKKAIDGQLENGLVLLVGVSKSATKKVTTENIDNAVSAFVSSLK